MFLYAYDVYIFISREGNKLISLFTVFYVLTTNLQRWMCFCFGLGFVLVADFYKTIGQSSSLRSKLPILTQAGSDAVSTFALNLNYISLSVAIVFLNRHHTYRVGALVSRRIYLSQAVALHQVKHIVDQLV